MIRHGYISIRRQRGAVTVIVMVMFLTIVGYGAVVMLDMGAGELHDANLHESDTAAQLAAEAGLERAFYRFKNGTTCSNVARDPNNLPAADPTFTLGSGQFTVTAAVAEGSDCRITAVGRVGTAEATVLGLAKSATIINEPMNYTGQSTGANPFNSTWTVVLTSSQGETAWDSADNCTISVCPGSTGGSFRTRTNTGTSNQLLQGYAHRALPSPLTTTAGMTVKYSIGYKKQYSKFPQAQELSVRLYNSTTGLGDTIWSHLTALDSTVWLRQSGTTAVTAGRTYDRISIVFKLDETNQGGNRQIRMWIDEIQLNL